MARFKIHQLRNVSAEFAQAALNNTLLMLGSSWQPFDYEGSERFCLHMANNRKVEAIKQLRESNAYTIRYEICIGQNSYLENFSKKPNLRQAKDVVDMLWEAEIFIPDGMAQDLGLI